MKRRRVRQSLHKPSGPAVRCTAMFAALKGPCPQCGGTCYLASLIYGTTTEDMEKFLSAQEPGTLAGWVLADVWEDGSFHVLDGSPDASAREQLPRLCFCHVSRFIAWTETLLQSLPRCSTEDQ